MTSSPVARFTLVVTLIASATLVEPILHHWLHAYKTETAVATGLHTADSAIYLQAMEMLSNGYHSPYATCKAPNGPNDMAFLPSPFHWLYAIIGVVGNGIGANPFLFLGWANAFFGALYLWMVYRFLAELIPRYALTTFALFTLSGSIGGVLYLVGITLDWDQNPAFDTWLLRPTMYELVEGPYLNGARHIGRLYYTVPLALFYASLTALVQSLRIQCSKHLLLTGILLFAATFINVRIGGLGWLIMMLYLVTTRETLFLTRSNLALRISIPVALAFLAFIGLTALNPTFMRNTGVLVREGLWPTAFISVALFHLIIFPRPARIGFSQLPPLNQRVLQGIAGYLTLYSILFVGYQIYYGNFLQAGDFSAAVVISDWSLLGGLAAFRKPRLQSTDSNPEDSPFGWLVLWCALFIAIGISAFGQGWMLRLTPQRLLMFIGVPLSACSAYALHQWHETRPTPARLYGAAMLTSGIVSLLVGALYFQGPYHREPGQGPFASLHPEIMSPADAELIAQLPEGTVLAPPGIFADVIALHTTNQVLGGIGGTDLSDAMSTKLDPEIGRFFSAETSSEKRHAFVEEWCVQYIYCPDTEYWRTSPDTIGLLKEDSRFKLIATKNSGAVFEVL